MNNYMKTTLAIVFCLVFGLYGCKENSTNNQGGGVMSFLSSSDFTSLEEIMNDWDNGDLNGVLFISKDYQKVDQHFYDSGVFDTVAYENTSMSAKAGIFNSTYNGVNVVDFAVNSYDMERYSKGKYSNTKPDEFDSRFGTGVNRIYIDSNSVFDDLTDSVALGNAVTITNLLKNDVISKATGKNLTWSGSPTATKAYVEIFYTNTFDPAINNDSLNYGISWYMENLGSVELEPFINQLDYLGSYDLKVTLFEPHYIGLSNGNDILVVGESSYKTTFVLTN